MPSAGTSRPREPRGRSRAPLIGGVLPARPLDLELDSLLTSRDVAALLHVSPSTLCRWRDRGTGPAWLDLGGIPRYALADVASWIDDQRHDR